MSEKKKLILLSKWIWTWIKANGLLFYVCLCQYFCTRSYLIKIINIKTLVSLGLSTLDNYNNCCLREKCWGRGGAERGSWEKKHFFTRNKWNSFPDALRSTNRDFRSIQATIMTTHSPLRQGRNEDLITITRRGCLQAHPYLQWPTIHWVGDVTPRKPHKRIFNHEYLIPDISSTTSGNGRLYNN